MWEAVRMHEKKMTEYLEWAELKDAFHEVFAISDIGNKAFQDGEPWKTRTTDPDKAAKLIHNLCYMIKDLMIMAHPYLPQFSETILGYLGKKISEPKFGETAVEGGLNWSDLGNTEGLDTVADTAIFFSPLDQKTADAFRERYSGSQKDRKEKAGDKKKAKKESKKIELAEDQVSFFNEKIELKVAKIIKVENNPEGEKLYVETLDDGSGTPRIIQSGLREFLKPEDLLGKHIILASNLAPRAMRGIESHGMLLAADYKDKDGKDAVEVLEAPWAEPGTQVVLEGADPTAQKPTEITADEFFKVQVNVVNKSVEISGKKLVVKDKAITTVFTENGGVH